MVGDTNCPNLHFPIAILALAFAVFLGTQIGAAKQSVDITRWQIETARTNLERLKTQETQYAEALKNRETDVEKSKELQAQLEALLNDLLELADNDADAKRIVQKWNVKRNAK